MTVDFTAIVIVPGKANTRKTITLNMFISYLITRYLTTGQCVIYIKTKHGMKLSKKTFFNWSRFSNVLAPKSILVN